MTLADAIGLNEGTAGTDVAGQSGSAELATNCHCQAHELLRTGSVDS